MLQDTVATIVGSSAGHNLVVAAVKGIGNQGKETLCNIDDGATLTLTGKPLNLQAVTAEDRLIWKVGGKDNRVAKDMKFSLASCSLISPNIDGSKWYFECKDLDVVFNPLKT